MFSPFPVLDFFTSTNSSIITAPTKSSTTAPTTATTGTETATLPVSVDEPVGMTGPQSESSCTYLPYWSGAIVHVVLVVNLVT